ncbi:response regulator transcription factor [Antrihabitans cavernicola]|uniref:response regulator transcription factor n=1 Tax=Antrihabitans cavernicola TaxID=2495913 RepID=UPI001F437DC7|nr:LuxR C-terminal-related transcriptional regulator [Spelaeibacter cavernicola]
MRGPASIAGRSGGDLLFSPVLLRRLVDRAVEARPDSAPGVTPVDLTPRELEVLRLVGDGYSNQDIADRLYLGYQHGQKPYRQPARQDRSRQPDPSGRIRFQDRRPMILYRTSRPHKGGVGRPTRAEAILKISIRKIFANLRIHSCDE